MKKITKIGIITSGGDAPGMNACYRAVVRTALANKITPYAIFEGYYGIYHKMIKEIKSEDVSDIIQRGGTKIGTARFPELKELEIQKECAKILNEMGIDALVCIGGDGTYTGAMKLTELGINCIGLPGTIDNDILCTDFTIGFDTALNTIVENIDKIKETSTSHKRCAVVEVMGRYCPDLAVFAGLCCGAELTVSSLNPMTEDEICQALKKEHESGKRSALVVVAEHILDVHKLAKKIEEVSGYETRATVLGHSQRGGNPSASDRILASRLAYHAVLLLKEGKGGIALGIVDNKVKETPILDALNMKNTSYKSNKIEVAKEILEISRTIK